MLRREFTFTGGTSSKFWTIELNGTGHTVQFGRIGTAGQSKSKGFPSEEAARTAYDKLVAEKLKEGYVETGSAAPAAAVASVASTESPAAPAVPKPARKRSAPPTAPAESAEPVAASPLPVADVSAAVAPAAAPLVATSAAAAAVDLERRMDLAPEDWLWAVWRPRVVRRRSAPEPFQRAHCLALFSKRRLNWAGETEPGYGGTEDYEGVTAAARGYTPEEAHFWLAAAGCHHGKTAEEWLPELEAQKFNGHPSPEEVQALYQLAAEYGSGAFLVFLAQLVPAGTLFEVLAGEQPDDHMSAYRAQTIAESFRTQILPYLTEDEVAEGRRVFRERIPAIPRPTGKYDRVHLGLYIAARLGMPDLIRPIVESWENGRYSSGYSSQHPELLVFGLASGEEVAAQTKRLGMSLDSPDHLRAWLALTEFSRLAVVRDAVATEKNVDRAVALAEVLRLVKAPEAAPHMLDLKFSSKAPKVADAWLRENPGHAVAGLVPVAAGRSKLAEKAVGFLREMKAAGHADFIAARAAELSDVEAARVRTEVLEYSARTYAPFDDTTTPDWLRAGLDAVAVPKKIDIPAWASAEALPPLVVGDRRLSEAQVRSLMTCLSQAELGSPPLLLAGLREHAANDARDRFTWSLFESWIQDGAPPKQKWAMRALGFLGTDATALRLTPLVRAWPGESQHPRAVLGLECLRAIGSNVALMQLSGIAQKVKFKGLQKTAMEFVEAIAAEMDLTRDELEDRVVPDCGLDERGSREFDFGPRKYMFVLDADMKPAVRDEEGKVRKDLPKPSGKDDAEKAKQALADWGDLKKQLREILKIQTVRLEQGMITGRRWTPGNFESLLVRHPLMTNLARRLLWAGFDAKGQRLQTFRVTDERDYADADDNAVLLEGCATIGLLHPLHLTEAELRRWGEHFSDYEVVPPFAQLGRATHRLSAAEAAEVEFTRFKGLKIPALQILGLERFGWIRGPALDNGVFEEHYKHFWAANVTASISYEWGIAMGMFTEAEDQVLTCCCFLPGLYRPTGWPRHQPELTLGSVDPIVVSEVLNDLLPLAEKATG